MYFLANADDINWVRDRDAWFGLKPWWIYNITTPPLKELEGLEYHLPVGSLVGGSSAINGMQVLRGTSDDYNRWASFFSEGSGWSWEDILPYFKKASGHFMLPADFWYP